MNMSFLFDYPFTLTHFIIYCHGWLLNLLIKTGNAFPKFITLIIQYQCYYFLQSIKIYYNFASMQRICFIIQKLTTLVILSNFEVLLTIIKILKLQTF